MPVSYKNLSRLDSLSESITSLQFNGWLLHPFHSSLSFPWINSDYTMIGFFLEKLSLFIIRTSPRHRIALQYYFWLSYPSFVAFALWDVVDQHNMIHMLCKLSLCMTADLPGCTSTSVSERVWFGSLLQCTPTYLIAGSLFLLFAKPFMLKCISK